MITPSNKNRCVIVGVDGATFEILDRLAARGALPGISEARKSGVQGVLKSSMPMLSPSIWTTIITGKKADKHGIFDFIRHDAESDSVVFNSANDRCAAPLWNILSEAGRRVCVAGLMLTYPPDKVNGCMVAGTVFDVTVVKNRREGVSATWPPELAAELDAKMGASLRPPRKNAISRKARRIQLGNIMVQSARERAELYKSLSDRELFDIRFFYFSETDIMSHLFWTAMKKGDATAERMLSEVYEVVDGFIGRLLAEKDTDVMIVSDHGFRPLRRVVSINHVLAELGFLSFRKRDVAERARIVLKRLVPSVISRRGKDPFSVLNLEELVAGVAWDATRAYYFGTSGGTIYLNMKEREKNGIVESGQRVALCSELKSALEGFRDPLNGALIFERVFVKDELFTGPCSDRAPDIYVEFAEGYGVKAIKDGGGSAGKSVVDAKLWSGDHHEDGVFLGAGPRFKSNGRLHGACVCDIAPTALYLAGCALPGDMDGKILFEALNASFTDGNDAVYSDRKPGLDGGYESGAAYGKQEEAEIAERLKNLGYI